MKFGPFTNRINQYARINLYNYDDPETIGFWVPNEDDRFLQDINALDIDISQGSADINIQWEIHLDMRDGIELRELYVNVVWGVLNFDIVVDDSIIADKSEEYTHSIEFNTESTKKGSISLNEGWELVASYEKLSLVDGIFPYAIDINFKSKKISVEFE